jgi:hypothetical protein
MQQGRRAYEALYVYTRQGRPDSSCQMWWNLKAYEAYLHYQWGFAEGSVRRSRECLEQA